MPKLFDFGRYVVFFWAGEDGEPVHVHVSVRRPSENSLKVWLTRSGGCLVARDNLEIPRKDLRNILDFIALNHRRICSKWRDVFGEEPVFYK